MSIAGIASTPVVALVRLYSVAIEAATPISGLWTGAVWVKESNKKRAGRETLLDLFFSVVREVVSDVLV